MIIIFHLIFKTSVNHCSRSTFPHSTHLYWSIQNEMTHMDQGNVWLGLPSTPALRYDNATLLGRATAGAVSLCTYLCHGWGDKCCFQSEVNVRLLPGRRCSQILVLQCHCLCPESHKILNLSSFFLINKCSNNTKIHFYGTAPKRCS